MRNLLILSFLFASALKTTAQTEENKFEYFTTHLAGPGVNVNSLTSDADHALGSTAESFASLHLKVFGLVTQTPMDADIDIFLNSDFIKDQSGKVENGEFKTRLNSFGWYIISLSAPGYFEASDTVWVVSEKRKSIERDFYMIPIEVGMNITTHFNFNFDKTILPQPSMAALDEEVLFLNKNPNVVFEIAGHTDSDGSNDYNLLLSQRRAQAVVDYLVSKGAEPKQLIAHGYGETRPMNSNKTKFDKANNRRVEFKVHAMELNLAENQKIKINSGRKIEANVVFANEIERLKIQGNNDLLTCDISPLINMSSLRSTICFRSSIQQPVPAIFSNELAGNRGINAVDTNLKAAEVQMHSPKEFQSSTVSG